MDLDSRSQRNYSYMMWMIGTAFIPVGLSFEPRSFLQFLFLGIGISLFVLGHTMFRGAWKS